MRPPINILISLAKRQVPVSRALRIIREAGYTFRTEAFLRTYNPLLREVIQKGGLIRAETLLRRVRFDKPPPDELFRPTQLIHTGRKYRIQGTGIVQIKETSEIKEIPFTFTTNRRLTRGQLYETGRGLIKYFSDRYNADILDINIDFLFKMEE